MAYRLGLDIGANSIGWCALTLDATEAPAGILGLGIRVYPDGRNPKDSTSLAAARRRPRGMRRNRDRYLKRRTALLNALTRFGLMPAEEEARLAVVELDPYALRAAGLERRLVPEELGRAIFHLSQHRGFKSNRKADRSSNEGGLIKDAAAITQTALARGGFATLGAWLASRHSEGLSVRARLAGAGQAASYPFYPTREMVAEEFDTLWAAQAGWNPGLTDAMRDALKSIIFFQRKLRSPSVGKCWLEPAEERASRALPTAQRFRIAQTVAHLRLSAPGEPDRPLSGTERQVLLGLLYRGSNLTFDQMRKKLGLVPETDFNTREDKLTGCATAARLGAKKIAGADWHAMELAQQNDAVRAIIEAETDEAAVAVLTVLGLPADAAIRAVTVTLPDGHAALSVTALGKILPHLEAGRTYADAVRAAGYTHHSDRRTGEVRTVLPYYGELLRELIGTGTGELGDAEEKRFGRAPNPTVHVALNEIRRVVNAILARHGAPKEIVVETLRDLGRSKAQREDYERQQKKNRDANDRRRAMLAEMGLKVNADNMMRLRLWEEQATDPKQRMCPYTGTLITPVTALSAAIEEDHILPFAMALDDSSANRVLVTRESNRVKAKRTPFEAFGHRPDWPAILERVLLLPRNKRWRFQPDALAKFEQDGDFLARHLTDSATIARWAVAYLEVLAPGQVRAVPGRLTALLRHALGLNSRSVLGKGDARKDRNDHRHHAIDAVVVGLTDRGMLQRVTRAAKAADGGQHRLLQGLEPAWEGLVAEVAARVRGLVVSHKPDVGWQAALHNDTAYGAIGAAGPREPNVVVRRPLETIATWSAEDARVRVRDPALAAKVAAALSAGDTATRRAALAGLTHSGGHIVRRVRTTERLDGVQAIVDRRTGAPYKLVKRDGNHRTELWRLPDGTARMTVISTFEAARAAEAARLGRTVADLRPHPAAKLLMRLHKNDLVALGEGRARRIVRVVQMSEGFLTLADHNEAGNLRTRHADKDDSFRYLFPGVARLITDKARKVQVTPDGRVRDPGPPG